MFITKFISKLYIVSSPADKRVFRNIFFRLWLMFTKIVRFCNRLLQNYFFIWHATCLADLPTLMNRTFTARIWVFKKLFIINDVCFQDTTRLMLPVSISLFQGRTTLDNGPACNVYCHRRKRLRLMWELNPHFATLCYWMPVNTNHTATKLTSFCFE